MRHWINVVPLSHVATFLKAGNMAVKNGVKPGVHFLSRGDSVIFYSPRRKGVLRSTPVREFTAHGIVTDDLPYLNEPPDSSSQFQRFRRNVKYSSNLKRVDVRELVHQLDFIRSKDKWESTLDRSLFEIPEMDYKLITMHLGVTDLRGEEDAMSFEAERHVRGVIS
jgi:EVE domain